MDKKSFVDLVHGYKFAVEKSMQADVFWTREDVDQIEENIIAVYDQLVDAIEGLLDGLDANYDERCGYTETQWALAIGKAWEAIGKEDARDI